MSSVSNGIVSIGALQFNKDDVIGTGCAGTKVYRRVVLRVHFSLFDSPKYVYLFQRHI